jgi:manganese/zinc/iron transport system permease protein
MSYDFILILTALCIAIPNSILGGFLVLRKMSMIGDALSHAVLPGIAIAFFLTGETSSFWSLQLATVLGICSVLVIQLISGKGGTKQDAAIGLVYTLSFSIGIILITSGARNADLDVECVLFGDLGNVPFQKTHDLLGWSLPSTSWGVLTIGIISLIITYLFRHFLISTSFDPSLSESKGISTYFWNTFLLCLTSISTVYAFDAVGAIMVVSLLVVPPSFALLFAKRTPAFFGISALFATASILVGYFLSILINLNIVATISAFMGAFLILTIGIRRLIDLKKQPIK